jgi:leader peptidase (prepilin peptidase)/N-methyltransferase
VAGAAALLVVAAPRAEAAPGLVPVAVLTVPLVLSDVRRHRLPNALTVPLLVVGAALTLLQGAGTLVAVVATALALGVLWGTGGLGAGDVKLGAGLAAPLAGLGAEQVALGPAAAFLLAGAWVLLPGRRPGRIPLGPFLLAGFWLAAVV